MDYRIIHDIPGRMRLALTLPRIALGATIELGHGVDVLSGDRPGCVAADSSTTDIRSGSRLIISPMRAMSSV